MPDLEFEIQSGFPQKIIAGVDEVGRGCLAGSVVACAVILPAVISYESQPFLKDVTDSKKLSPGQREKLAPLLRSWVRAFSLGEASVEEIDRINILQASLLAMKRACESLNVRPDVVLVDGNQTPPGLAHPVRTLIKGDSLSLSIACASIIAKVHRDEMLQCLDKSYPGYGLAIHKGYGTPAHKKALLAKGPTLIHRKSFEPVASLLQKQMKSD